MDPNACRYAETHEWALLEGNVCTLGITAFAVEQLTDVTYVKVPAVGTKLEAKQAFGEVESVKAVSDVYTPVGGDVIEVNPVAVKEPAVVAQDPFGAGWLIKLRVAPGTTLAGLMTKDEYEKHVSEGH